MELSHALSSTVSATTPHAHPARYPQPDEHGETPAFRASRGEPKCLCLRSSDDNAIRGERRSGILTTRLGVAQFRAELGDGLFSLTGSQAEPYG